ncbi:MAG: 4-hydroxy-tetrahydrodipicolinate reductase, partial [Myxococcales bacterium]|nr:4-hydroxy-tetrahydrodipicolinate reductase [Myxococcales bacterium]
TGDLAAKAKATKTALVVGTTGLDDGAHRALQDAASVVPVVFAPNFSVGVNVLFHLAREATRLLGSDYDAEIVEMHHRHKVDAPSGTAVRLADVVREAKGVGNDALVYGRQGQVGARKADEIGVMTLRGGDVIGDHSLILAGEGERLELGHRAGDRGLFARGAVRAALWTRGQEPGFFGMEHVLGI